MVRDREMEIRKGPDVKIPLSLSAAPLKDDEGQEMGSVLLIRDLREIRDLQGKVRRSERLASLGRLAAGVAHEIRNPLSSIRGFAQYFVKRFHGQTEEEGYASVMVKEVDRLNRVITELLDFAGPKEPRREPNSLEDIADHALKLLAPDLAARKVEVFKEYQPGLPAVPVDRDQISQVFLNLLLNAIESMEGGGDPPHPSPMRSSAGRRGGDCRYGAGIPADDLEKVFEPFSAERGRAPVWAWRLSTRSSKATGERSGWRAAREEGRLSGSTCRWTATATRGTDMDEKRRILVVDDEESHRIMLRAVLSADGYAVAEASDGTEAVRAVGKEAFDLILMDIRMTNMDGIEALTEIRKISPLVPVLIMTAYASVKTAVEALKAGPSIT